MKNKIKKLGMIQKLEIKLVGLVMVSVLIILLIIGIVVCTISYQSNMVIIEEQLNAANEQSSRSYFSVQDYQKPEFDVLPNDLLSQVLPNFENKNWQNLRGKPNIGKHAEEPNYDIPIATYYLEQGNLKEVPNGTMTAYLNSTVINSFSTIAKESNEGISTNEEFEVVYSKSTIKGISFVAFTDISYYYSWTGSLRIMLFVATATLLLFLIASIIFAKWAAKPIKEAWDSQERFVEDASHDLKTPLTVILANLSILKTNPNKTIQEQSTWIDSIEEESERMTHLINNMLDLANIDKFAEQKKNHNNKLKPIDFSNIVQAQCLQIESIAFDKQLDFTSKIDEEIFIKANKDDLVKIASSLISNSCKHAPTGDSITVELLRKSNRAILSVNNKLSTISKEDLPHIFDRFYRSDKARTRTSSKEGEQSHGLGLAIANCLTQQLNGELSVDSKPESGTTFVANFPISAKSTK